MTELLAAVVALILVALAALFRVVWRLSDRVARLEGRLARR